MYRGLEYEKLAGFTQRLQAQFPNAKVRFLLEVSFGCLGDDVEYLVNDTKGLG